MSPQARGRIRRLAVVLAGSGLAALWTGALVAAAEVAPGESLGWAYWAWVGVLASALAGAVAWWIWSGGER